MATSEVPQGPVIKLLLPLPFKNYLAVALQTASLFVSNDVSDDAPPGWDSLDRGGV